MGIENFMNCVTRRGGYIVTSDPATRRIEIKVQNGETVQVNAYTFSPLFRWPQVGEKWLVREENGSWFLDSIWEETEEGITPEPGDAIINSGNGRVLINENGVLKPFTGVEAWKPITLINSWHDAYTTSPSYCKDPLGNVHLRGRIIGGGNGSAALVLPPKYRPEVECTYPLAQNGGTGPGAFAYIAADGTVEVFYGGSPADIGLGGLTFLAVN